MIGASGARLGRTLRRRERERMKTKRARVTRSQKPRSHRLMVGWRRRWMLLRPGVTLSYHASNA
jgi:hypothetical protein